MARDPSAAPGSLEAIRELINTRDAGAGSDALTTPAQLAEWLLSHRFAAESLRPTAAELQRARELREALRTLALANNGEPGAAGALAALAAQARRSELRVTFAGDGAPVTSGGRGVDAALGEVLARVASAMHDGSWERLKACPRDDCRWAFYDNSRNRTRTWCSMRVCGNRAKVESYRRRHGDADQPSRSAP